MRTPPFIIAFLLLLSTAVLASYMSQPDSHKILRVGYKHIKAAMEPDHPSYIGKLQEPISLIIKQQHEEVIAAPAGKQPIELNTDSLYQSSSYLPTQIQILEELDITDGEPSLPLNLALPKDLELETWALPQQNSDTFSRLFKAEKRMSRFNFSGQLHFDDSEEAEELPLEKTILGAELEFEWRLP